MGRRNMSRRSVQVRRVASENLIDAPAASLSLGGRAVLLIAGPAEYFCPLRSGLSPQAKLQVFTTIFTGRR